MRTLITLLFGLTIISCNSTEKENKISKQEIEQTSEPVYNTALKFINDYLDYSNHLKGKVKLIEWIENRTDVTDEFKIELKRILTEAKKKDPELGLGFDPILDAQDNPNKFKLDKTDSEFLIVRGVKWPNFRLTLKVKLVDDKWLVDGSGIVRIPRNKRVER